MKITTTAFEFNYHNSQKAGNFTYGEYVLQNIDVWNKIVLDDSIELYAVYQTAMSYDHNDYNDYNCPSPHLALSEDGGACKALVLIDELCEDDFENERHAEWLVEQLEKVQELCPAIKSMEDMRQLYNALNDNMPQLAWFLDPDEYTDDFNDYVEDEGSGILTLKTDDFYESQAEEFISQARSGDSPEISSGVWLCLGSDLNAIRDQDDESPLLIPDQLYIHTNDGVLYAADIEDVLNTIKN